MKKIIFLLFFVVLLTSSCNKFLDKRDPTATSFDEFFNTEEDLRRVVYSSYADIFTTASKYAHLFYMNEGKSDNAYSRVESHYHQQIANGNFNANTKAFQYYYSDYMKHVGRLNTFIANIDRPYVEDESIREKYKNILEALRIWHYFRITSRWGDVPFSFKPVTLKMATQEATPRDKILNTIFPLAEEIANKLPEKEYVTDAYMFNRYSFKAIIMRYALYYGRYEMAARLAKEIMDSRNYSLYPVYGSLFQYDGCAVNREFIIRENRESNQNADTYSFRDLGPHYRTGGGQSHVVPLKALVDSYWTRQGRSIDNCPIHTKEEYELNPGLNRDPRYAATIMGNGDLFYGEKIDIYNINSPMYYQAARGSKSGYWFKKWVSEDDAFKPNGKGNMEYPLLRYAEVLLTYAEAKIMLNDIDPLAKKCINDIRIRAGLDMSFADVTKGPYATYTQSQWIELVRNERRIEFAGEGLRYDDIIRWRIAEKVMNCEALGHTRKIDGQLVSLKIENREFRAPDNYLWPFHESFLKVEPGVHQNSGY